MVINRHDQHVLTVRKRGTYSFMLPGGKLEPSETATQAVLREVREELLIEVDERQLCELGTFRAQAANETDCLVEATVFVVPFVPVTEVGAEIAELRWQSLDAGCPALDLAPLLTGQVFPALRTEAGRPQAAADRLLVSGCFGRNRPKVGLDTAGEARSQC